MKIVSKLKSKTKRHLCASGSILLPLAQKWGLVGVVACGLSIIGAGNVSAAELTITIPGNLSVDIMPSAEGSVAESTPAQLKISSDAPWGYTLSVKSSTDSNALMNGQNLLSSISSKLNDKNSFSNNTWGFKFTGGSASDSKYWPGPKNALTALDNVTTTEPTTTKSEKQYDFTIATKVDNTIAAGTYTGSFTFTAVANSADYTINFNMRDGDNGPKTMQGSTQDATVKLASSIPANVDHVFLGWCDQEVTGNGPCDGTIYQPDENYVLKSANENTTLYALYDGDVVYMQNWKGCTKYLTKNTQFTLTDKRDDKKYFVAKLADDNCWMTENLDLDLNPDEPLTPDSSDVEKEWTPKEPTRAKSDTTWKALSTEPESYDPGDYCWAGERTWANGNGQFDTDTRICNKHDESHYHIGNCYNFTAIVAQDNSSDHTTNGATYDTSICPAGWQLPTNNGEKSFTNLQNAIKEAKDPKSPEWTAGYIEGHPTAGQEKLSKSTIHADPYYFTYTGFWRGYHGNFGYEIYYPSNTVVNNIISYHLRFDGVGRLDSQHNTAGLRSDAFPVRCVARE